MGKVVKNRMSSKALTSQSKNAKFTTVDHQGKGKKDHASSQIPSKKEMTKKVHDFDKKLLELQQRSQSSKIPKNTIPKDINDNMTSDEMVVSLAPPTLDLFTQFSDTTDRNLSENTDKSVKETTAASLSYIDSLLANESSHREYEQRRKDIQSKISKQGLFGILENDDDEDIEEVTQLAPSLLKLN